MATVLDIAKSVALVGWRDVPWIFQSCPIGLGDWEWEGQGFPTPGLGW